MRLVLPGVFLLAASGAAQEEATTIYALSGEAGAVVTAVAGNPATRGADLEVAFSVVRTWKGAVPSPLVLREPDGRRCGGAIALARPARTYILFLDRGGGDWRVRGGDRGLVPATLAIAAALDAWFAAPDGASRSAVLASGLSSADRRVRRDSAAQLAIHPFADPLSCAPALAAALRRALAQETSLLPAVLQASSRHAPSILDEVALPFYLSGGHRDLAKSLSRALRSRDRASLRAAIERHWPTSDEGRVRAAQVLAGEADSSADETIVRLLRECRALPAQFAVAALLPSAVRREKRIRELAPPEVLDLADRKEQQPPERRNVRVRKP